MIAQNPVHSKTLVARGTPINLVVGSLGDNPVTIPSFRNRNTAGAFIRDNGLTLGRISQEETDDYPAGTVLRQSPSEGKQYGRNCPVTVNLLIATPIVWVFTNNYVGLSEQQARQQLISIDLRAQVTYQESSNDPPGRVLQQSPPPQTKVKHQSYVTLVVAVPAQVKLVPVPSVCGMTLDQARATLKQFGFVNADNDIAYASPPKLITCGKGVEGTVFTQDPMPNTKVPPGTRIKLKLVNFNIGEN